MGGEPADAQPAVFQLDRIEPAHRAKADETARPDQTLLHHNHKRGTAGDKLRVGPEFFQRGMNFLEIFGRTVFERYHGGVPYYLANWYAFWIDSMIL